MAVKQPQDHLSKIEPYRYRVGDSEIVLPPFKKAAKTGWLRKNRHLSEMDLTFMLIEDLLDEDQLALFDSLDLDEFEEFSKGWQQDSGVTLPESSAS